MLIVGFVSAHKSTTNLIFILQRAEHGRGPAVKPRRIGLIKCGNSFSTRRGNSSSKIACDLMGSLLKKSNVILVAMLRNILDHKTQFDYWS